MKDDFIDEAREHEGKNKDASCRNAANVDKKDKEDKEGAHYWYDGLLGDESGYGHLMVSGDEGHGQD